jgi:hypothetical protein
MTSAGPASTSTIANVTSAATMGVALMWFGAVDFGKLKTRKKYRDIINHLGKPKTSEQAVTTLVEIGAESIPLLVASIPNSPPLHRELAARVVGQIGAPATDALLKALETPHTDVLAFVLTCLKPTATVDMAIVARRFRDTWLLASSSVVELMHQEAVRYRFYKYGFVAVLDHAEPILRMRSLVVLGALSLEWATPYLIRGLKDEDEFVRVQAALALIDCGRMDGIEAVRSRSAMETVPRVSVALERLTAEEAAS